MRFGYNILFVLFFWLSAPYYFWKMWRRGHWRAGFAQRFAFYNAELKAALAQRPVIWLHAVSVGEVGVCLQLIRALEPQLGGFQILVSTTTSTGMAELQRQLPPHVHRIYYPADFAGVVRRALKTIRPRAIILVEAELWPNFLWQATDRAVPLFLINARISERSLQNYQRFSFLFRPIFARFCGVGCQQSADARHMLALGFSAEAVRVPGNLKFDAAQPGPRPALDVVALLSQIGVSDKALLLVAGSTHAGEEALLAEMLPCLRARFPGLFLIIVPRHFERAREAGQELETRGVKFIYRTDITGQTSLAAGAVQCLLVNSTGELKSFYEHASVVMIGKSFTARGGQNPIEPAALAKPVVFGPNMQNFKSVAHAFLANQAAIQVQNAAELEQVLIELLGDEQRRMELGQRALAVVRENLGATDRTVQFILERLAATGAPPSQI